MSIGALRARVSKWAVTIAIGFIALIVGYSGDGQPLTSATHLLTPGAMTTAHSPIRNCRGCHSSTAKGRFGWLHAIVAAASPRDDSAACQVCHETSPTALNPHGLALDTLEALTKSRLAADPFGPPSVSTRVRDAAFPVKRPQADTVFCATCHKEHQGKAADLKAMSDVRCQTCHAGQFNSFQDGHPRFTTYPFERHTRIVFDHASHFGNHFPRTLEKGVSPDTVPSDTCADCHITAPDKRHMLVRTFDQMCSTCHLDQIVGEGRATGPKGIAAFSLPGLDLSTLMEKNAAIGEWPKFSEAEITPLMKLMIGWNAENRQLLKAVAKIDLLDLSEASDEEVAMVEKLVWEVKGLLHLLTSTKITGVAQRLSSATGAQIDTHLLTQLMGSVPRDVLTGAQLEWLPNLNEEIVRHRKGERVTIPDPNADREPAVTEPAADAPATDTPDRSGDDQTDILSDDDTAPPVDTSDILSDDDAASSVDTSDILSGDDSDILTGDESLETETDDGKAASTAGSETSEADGSSVIDAETWAELGGWYRRDFEVLFKPTGHADSFMRAWLDFSGSLFGKKEAELASPVFNMLTAKHAQGQCTKCHSLEGIGERLIINWRPFAVIDKKGSFTTFSHEPHFGFLAERGCLTCHDIKAAAETVEGEKKQDPTVFVSNFKPIEQELCATCHGKEQAGEDCQLCHRYHVFGVFTPIIATKIPGK
ncbi:MAG: hypothetical protein ACR2PM_08350 [Hyphomicrobiales bacterium]